MHDDLIIAMGERCSLVKAPVARLQPSRIISGILPRWRYNSLLIFFGLLVLSSLYVYITSFILQYPSSALSMRHDDTWD
ncbi:hypothetical protein PILCRDRAFT_542007 [Piloderma croceum F 1598]|uniref:Uncharacterized protein n=1 Tax=Piloderma croceum (strain F 1598) TaxID=765440 RepID=A0A0C3B1C2_PILCF|nr:hypothetical protein PILCRDRAFT_542007 [Piloderma croceum F 1598]